MKQIFQLDPWKIIEDQYRPEYQKIAESIFNLPVRIASYKYIEGASKPEYAAAVGMIKHIAKRNKHSKITVNQTDIQFKNKSKFKSIVKKITNAVNNWFSL